jgi:hypothetical protein
MFFEKRSIAHIVRSRTLFKWERQTRVNSSRAPGSISRMVAAAPSVRPATPPFSCLSSIDDVAQEGDVSELEAFSASHVVLQPFLASVWSKCKCVLTRCLATSELIVTSASDIFRGALRNPAALTRRVPWGPGRSAIFISCAFSCWMRKAAPTHSAIESGVHNHFVVLFVR